MGETQPIKCPFCGAPYRDVIPADVVQVKCKYCGGIFQVPPTVGAEVSRCIIHPEKVAVGMCNDCGQSFCGNCLHVFNLVTRDTRATLYLCPNCLRARYARRLQGYIYTGALLLVMSVFFGIAVPAGGVVLFVLGLVAVLYGFFARSGTIEEPTIDELKGQQERRKAEVAEQGEADYEAMYDELVNRYVNRWGASEGLELLDEEISAYTRHGQSYPEAVIAVYRRQKEKSD